MADATPPKKADLAALPDEVNKDLGVSDDKLLDTALKAVDKIADACEVKDADFDEMFDC